MKNKLNRIFFTQNTLKAAKELLGKYLVRTIPASGRAGAKKVLAGKIVETEAYIGPKDKASHAYSGKKTERNKAEYLIGGHVYIYLVYGMYWQFNVSTGKEGQPECVLIRALEIANKHESEHKYHEYNKFVKIRGKLVNIRDLANGPGKLCRFMKLDKTVYGEDLTRSPRIWLEDRGVKIKKSEIKSGPRIGIDYAGPVWAKKPWRFWIKGNSCVSKKA